MPAPEEVRNQIERLTSSLIGLSLCDRQNFPTLRECGKDCREVGISCGEKITCALKNLPYREVYAELERAGTYNLRMLDGALIQMMYRFRNDQIETHRLAFLPSPFLEEFQNSPEVYLDDVVYAEVIMKNIVPFPLRFDFDSRGEVAVDVDHPKSHLTLGQYQNCRIPVSAPLAPYRFISFILRNFYNTVFCKYCEQMPSFSYAFESTITKRETELLHVQVPR